MRAVSERIGNQYSTYENIVNKIKGDIRVAIPGIIQSFNSAEQTVTVQPSIKEKVADKDGNVSMVNLPLLLDVPIVIPRAGGIVLTLPIQSGDECLVIFADSCIDAWWGYGGVQAQAEKRRHDLSDGFAILGTWSQPNVVQNYNTYAAELRTIDGSQKIQVSQSGINLVGNVMKNGVPL